MAKPNALSKPLVKLRLYMNLLCLMSLLYCYVCVVEYIVPVGGKTYFGSRPKFHKSKDMEITQSTRPAN